MNKREEKLIKHISSLQGQIKKHREIIVRLRFTIKAILITSLVIILTIISIEIPQNYQIVRKPIVKQASMEEKRANKAMAKSMARIGWNWTGKQWVCLDNIFKKESKYDQFANNKSSTAYGIGQVLGEKSDIPAVQITRAYKYIETRYGTPCSAYKFHLRRNWY